MKDQPCLFAGMTLAVALMRGDVTQGAVATFGVVSSHEAVHLLVGILQCVEGQVAPLMQYAYRVGITPALITWGSPGRAPGRFTDHVARGP